MLVLLGATAVAFAVTEGLKLEPSPIRSVTVDKVFSPTCECGTNEASVRFRLRKSDRLTLDVVDSSGNAVRTLIGPRTVPKGIVTARWDGRDDDGAVVADGAYRPRVHLRSAHRTIVLPNPIVIDTNPPRIVSVRAARHVLEPRHKLSMRYRVSEPARVSMYIGGKRVVRGRSSKTSWKLDWTGGRRNLRPGTYRLTLVARDIAGNISMPSRAIRVRVPISIAPIDVRPKTGTRFAVHLQTDGRPYRWRFGGRSGTARATRLVLRAPTRPGRYALVVFQHGDRAVAAVRVRRRP